MNIKTILWGFPGVGKSSISDNVNIIDADCELFQFIDIKHTDLHGHFNGNTLKNPHYPQNYIDYVNNVQADIVFINCHLYLMHHFPNAILVYPSKELKNEYLDRYRIRNDHSSYIEFMKDSFEQMIDMIEQLPNPLIKITEENVYLKNILEELQIIQEGEITMADFITKKDIVELLEKAIRFNVFPDLSYFEANKTKSIEETAQDVFEEKLQFDFETLKRNIYNAALSYGKEYCGTYVYETDTELKVISVGQSKNGVWVREEFNPEKNCYYGFKIEENENKFKKMLEEGYKKTNEKLEVGIIKKHDLDGFSKEEAIQIVMDAIALGILKCTHTQIYPYTYGYEIEYKGNCFKPKGNPFEMSTNIVRNIELGKKEHAVFGSKQYNYHDISIKSLQDEVLNKISNQSKDIIPDETTSYYQERINKRPWDRAHIATTKDLDEGKAVDGIITGFYQGDYSSYTTSTQNDWMRAQVALRGYCLDYVADNHNFPFREEIINYHKERGVDISNEHGLHTWIRKNRGKCAFKENREIEKLYDRISKFQQKNDSENRVMQHEDIER